MNHKAVSRDSRRILPMTTVFDRIMHVLNAHGITEAEVQERIELHRRGGYFHRVRFNAEHFRAADVAAILELLRERHAREMEVAALPALEAVIATALPHRKPSPVEQAVVIPPAPAQRGTLNAAEVARFCFGRRGTQHLPGNFPPRDRETGTWSQSEVEAWMSENLANGGKYAIAAMKRAKALSKP